jgi:hypothetical protein
MVAVMDGYPHVVLELGSRTQTQPAPAAVLWLSLTRPRDRAARQWLDLLDDEVDPQILESVEPTLVVWSSLWPDRRTRA